MKQVIPIFFTVDDGYVPFLSVALVSLLKNASKEYFYKIHVVHDNMSLENRNRIKSLETDNCEIIFSSMDQDLRCIIVILLFLVILVSYIILI